MVFGALSPCILGRGMNRAEPVPLHMGPFNCQSHILVHTSPFITMRFYFLALLFAFATVALARIPAGADSSMSNVGGPMTRMSGSASTTGNGYVVI